MNVLRARRKIWIDTVYIDKETPDLFEDPSKYANFKAKFGRKMVDSINKVVSPEYRISTRKTYVCRWRLYEAYYNANPGEQVAVRPSPLCALIPEKNHLIQNADIRCIPMNPTTWCNIRWIPISSAYNGKARLTGELSWT